MRLIEDSGAAIDQVIDAGHPEHDGETRRFAHLPVRLVICSE
ncbi:MAG TPA: hypothetical protein VGF54_19620 [Streptosporangiaceae bacterium]|jgi:hypothetical protein